MMRSIESAAGSTGRCESSNCIQADVYVGDHLTEPVVRARSTQTDTVMQARITEWRKFVAEVKNGDWDHIDTDWEIAAARQLPSAQVVLDEERRIPRLGELVDAAEHKAR